MAGLAPGGLAALAFAPGVGGPSALMIQAGALAGGGLLLLIASLLARRPHDEPDRGAHFARGASAGLVGIPALAAGLLGVAPGPRFWFLAIVLLVAASLFVASRRRAPAGGLVGQLGAALTALVGGSLAVLLAGGLAAVVGAGEVERNETIRNAIFDHDATVATVALPACAPRAERIDLLSGTGAHPRLTADGQQLFFDAPGPDGRRQIHRRKQGSGEVRCLSCDEPGNNRRPAPNADGGVVLFETDRYVTWQRPNNTELQLMNSAGAERGVSSRRITYLDGPDERPIFGPAPNTLAWSRGEAGRYRVVSAGLVSGHGSMQVGGVGTIHESGANWTAPLGWAPDARTLAVAEGNPLGPAAVAAVDPATSEGVELGETVTTAGGLSFNADGGWFALATARRGAAAGLLPGTVGFALAPALAAWGAEDGLDFHPATEVFWGATGSPPRPVDLGESAGWGWPTGIALEADGTGFVLGQRRAGDDGVEERLIGVRLDCS